MRFIAFVLVSVVVIVKHGYCRNCRGEQPIRTCENLCDENNKCKIRAAILLPSNTSYSASLPTVEPVLELALQSEAVRAVFPSWLEFEWKTYDVVDCDAAYAVISSIDAYNDCAHLFLGPSCDFALASVARIAKFLATSGGTPVMTTGGFTFDFVQPKKTCDHEFYMLVRTGAVGFQDVAYFIIKLMEEYKWRQLQLITEPDSQMSVGGKSTCHLMMRTLANSVKDKGYHYSPWDIDSTGGKNYTDNLKYYLGYKYTSK